MAFQTGSATDLEDLLVKISTFLQANGWTEDEYNNGTGTFAISKSGAFGDIYTSFRWDTGTPLHLSVHQALGWTVSTEPGNHPDDSGNGYNTTSSHTNTNLATERHVSDLGNGPYPSYYIFEDDHYAHIEVEISTDVFRRFGMGLLDKFSDWTGGEYAYGMRMGTGTNHSGLFTSDYALLDGIAVENDQMATVHVEGLQGEGGASKWGIAWGGTSAVGNDTGGQPREALQGGFRGGPVALEMGWFNGNSLSGNVPMYSIGLWHKHSSLQRVYYLGQMPNVRALNIRHFQPKEEVVIGGDTWVIFPFALRTEANVANRTYYSGIAHKKVTT